MDWKEQIEFYTEQKQWENAIVLLQNLIADNLHEVKYHIELIYLLHDVTLEQEHPGLSFDYLSGLLTEVFSTANKLFDNNQVFLFFMPQILTIAEWLFGLEEESKPLYLRLDYKMAVKALSNEPNNILLEYTYRSIINDPLANYLAANIILYEKEKMEWLKSYGIAGKYVIDGLNTTVSRSNRGYI
jgi:hypothetical protein